MRTTRVTTAVALAYLALLLWFGDAGIRDEADWSDIEVALVWLTWLSSSIVVGVTFARADALWLPVGAVVALLTYAALWPDNIVNEVWLLFLAFETAVSATFVGLGVAIGRRQTSRRTRP